MSNEKVAIELLKIAKSLIAKENKLFVRASGYDESDVKKAKKEVKRLKGKVLEDGIFYDSGGDEKDYVWAKFTTEADAKKYLSFVKRLGLTSSYLADNMIGKYL